MRKMLVLILLLGVAGVARGAISLIDNGDDTVDVHLEAGNLAGYTLFLDVVGGTAGAPAAMADFMAWALSLNLVMPIAMPDMEGHDWKYTGAGIVGVSFITGPISFISGIPVTLTADEAVVTLIAKPGGTVIDGQFHDGLLDEITIPEPVTMGLLGLGGLVAIRRRRG